MQRAVIGGVLLALSAAAALSGCGGQVVTPEPTESLVGSPFHAGGSPGVADVSDAGEAPDLGIMTETWSECPAGHAGKPLCLFETGNPNGPSLSVGCAYGACYSSGVCTGCECVAVDGGAAWSCRSVQPDSGESDDSGPDGCGAMGGSCLFDGQACPGQLATQWTCPEGAYCCMPTGAAPMPVADASDAGESDDATGQTPCASVFGQCLSDCTGLCEQVIIGGVCAAGQCCCVVAP